VPSLESMEQDIREVLEYCRDYRGANEDVFAALRERLSEVDQPDSGSEALRRERIGGMYEDAISTLLLLAEPPGQDQYQRVLDGIGTIAGIPINGVRFYEEAPSEAVVAERVTSVLWESLPPRRQLAEGDVEVLDFFKAQLPAREFGGPPFGAK
jgi:hypothetical protein